MWGFKSATAANSSTTTTSSTTMTPPRRNLSPQKDRHVPAAESAAEMADEADAEADAEAAMNVQSLVEHHIASAAPRSPFRPRHQQDELEALRQRGLAKLLNKHFTEATAKLAAEKAAVDAALKDLEDRKRKASSSSSVGSNSKKNSKQQHPQSLILQDDMYHKIHQMKTECRQKEKETLLLYQRYVHKFGFTGQIKAPSAFPKEKTPKDKSHKSPKNHTSAPSLTTTTTTGGEGVPGETCTRSVSSISSRRKEALSLIVEQDASSAVDDQAEVLTPKASPKSSPLRMATTEAITVTPLDVGVPAVSPLAPPVSEDDDYEEDEDDDDPEMNILKQYFPQNNVDEGDEHVESDPLASFGFGEEDNNEEGDDDDDDDDLSSLISGLTSVDSATTRQILLDCEITVATFLDEERKAIQHLMDEDSQKQHSVSSSASSKAGSIHSEIEVVNAASLEESESVLQAESMAQQMQQILLDYQQQSTTIVTDKNSGATTTESEFKTTELPGDDSLTTATTFSSGGAASPSANTSGRPYPTSNPDEDWIVLWDETYQREYFHESKSGVSQWHAPMAGGSIVSEDQDLDSFLVLDDASLDQQQPSDMMHIHVQNQNRILKYRARRRRRRRKKILRAAAVVLACFGAYYYFRYYRSSNNNNNAITMTVTSQPGMVDTNEQKGHSDSTMARSRDQEQKPKSEPVLEEPAQRVKDEKSSLFWTHVPETTSDSDLGCLKEEHDETAAAVSRPVGCNIPLAHVVSRKCSKLATEQPVFDLYGLVQVMMQ